ncbi:MAG: hypothetical protein FJ100_12985 [Deltaproteobacteria bacterium]|nr:hypothetical protein [Deltaproteobacteria bacterium]
MRTHYAHLLALWVAACTAPAPPAANSAASASGDVAAGDAAVGPTGDGEVSGAATPAETVQRASGDAPTDTATAHPDAAVPETAADAQDANMTGPDAQADAVGAEGLAGDGAVAPADTAAETAPAPDTLAADVGGQPDAAAPSPKVKVVVSAGLVETTAFGGKLTVQCQALGDDGTAAGDPGDFVVTFSGGAATAKEGAWTFAQPGAYAAICTSAKLGYGTAPFTVASAGLDPGLSRLATGLGKAPALVKVVLDSAANVVVQEKALADFHKVALTMTAGLGTGTKVLLPLPKGLPTEAALKAKGEAAAPDDAAFAAGVAKLSAALQAVHAAVKAVDPKTATEVDKVKIDAALAVLAAQHQALAALKPSALAVREQLGALDELLGVHLPKAAQAHALFLSKVLHAQPAAPPLPPCPGCFSLVGVAVSLGVQYALSAVPSYTGILKDLGWVIGEMVVTMTIKGVLDTQFPPAAGGPSIIAISALGQGAVPGMSLKIAASNFGNNPGECSVLFITPLVAKTIVDAIKLAVGGIPSLKDLKSKSAWEAAKVIKEAVDKLKEAAEFAGGLPDFAASGVVTMASQPGSTFDNEFGVINLGVVPKKINCGIVPKPGILYPVCAYTGGGASFDLLVIQESCK